MTPRLRKVSLAISGLGSCLVTWCPLSDAFRNACSYDWVTRGAGGVGAVPAEELVRFDAVAVRSGRTRSGLLRTLMIAATAEARRVSGGSADSERRAPVA